jgi:nucleoredoxin
MILLRREHAMLRHMFRAGPFHWCVLAAVLLLSAGRIAAGLPVEITVTQPARLELMRGGQVSGTIGLAAGEKLAVLDVADGYVLVRYRNVNGRVLAASTDLPPALARPAPAVPAASPAILAAPVPAPPASPARSEGTPPAVYVPATPMERMMAGKLVRLEGGALRPSIPVRLAGVKFYAFYFSASWCGPCQEFTPDLIDAYGKIRALYPEFEVIMVNRDRSPAEMFAYMRDDKMPWLALRWDDIRNADAINHYAGAGIPDLVLVDANGKVLSDSFRWGSYAGPDAVLDDTWKILRDYRRKNPRPKS